MGQTKTSVRQSQTPFSLIARGVSVVKETMAAERKNLGARKNVRVDLHQPGFLIPAPDAPWIECMILEVSDDGVCLDVGALAVPKIFGLAFTTGGEVLRVCSLIWRRGELIGGRFVTAKELRQGFVPSEDADQKAPAA